MIIALHPIACHHRKETNALLTATSCWAAVGSNEVSLHLPFFQTKQPQALLSLLVTRVVQPLHQPHFSSLCTPELLSTPARGDPSAYNYHQCRLSEAEAPRSTEFPISKQNAPSLCWQGSSLSSASQRLTLWPGVTTRTELSASPSCCAGTSAFTVLINELLPKSLITKRGKLGL